MTSPDDMSAIEKHLDDQRAIVIETVGATDEQTVRRRGDALWRVGEDLFQLERYDEAAVRLGEAAEVLWPFEAERSTAVFARARQATALEVLGRDQDAFEVMADLVGEIGLDWDDRGHPHVMALVLAQWVEYLPAMGLAEQVPEVADAVLQRFPADREPWERMAVGRALRQKAIFKVMEGNWTDALVVLDELVRRCPVEQQDAYRDESVTRLVAGLTIRGFVLEQLGRPLTAISFYDEALRIGANATAPGLREMLRDAQDAKMRLASQRQYARQRR